MRITFSRMDDAIKENRPGVLISLGILGESLKGCSAALGVRKVQGTCENIQQAGWLWKDGRRSLTEQEAMEWAKASRIQAERVGGGKSMVRELLPWLC